MMMSEETKDMYQPQPKERPELRVVSLVWLMLLSQNRQAESITNEIRSPFVAITSNQG